MTANSGDKGQSSAGDVATRQHMSQLFQTALDRVRAFADRLSLRGKFLFSLVLVILVMTFCTLLAVRELIEVRAEREMAQETRNSLATFQVMSRQQQMALNRKAELLATLAFLRDGDITAIRDASQDPWQSEDCDLFVLTSASGKVTALLTRIAGVRPPIANEAISNLLRSSSVPAARDATKSSQGWWVNGEHLYQIVIAPINQDSRANHSSGEVIVGHDMDSAHAQAFARVLS